MKQSHFQFHATSEELIGFFNNETYDLFVVGICTMPKFSVAQLSWPLVSPSAYRRLALRAEAFDTAASSMQEFARLNENSLHLTLPVFSEDCLVEGSLGFVIQDNETADKRYSSIVTKVKKMMRRGATAVNPITGAETSSKSHWYTAGALEMQQLGVVMRPMAGNSIINLGR